MDKGTLGHEVFTITKSRGSSYIEYSTRGKQYISSERDMADIWGISKNVADF